MCEAMAAAWPLTAMSELRHSGPPSKGPCAHCNSPWHTAEQHEAELVDLAARMADYVDDVVDELVGDVKDEVRCD